LNPAHAARIRNALPGYDIGGQIGSGGCGEVYGGMHRELRRPVAIKQIPPQFAADPEIRGRFASEATLMAAIDHPHVVSIYDYVQHDELCLLVMEFLPGGTVEDRFQTEGFDPSTTIAIALSCAAGLAHAHQHGVLHRDIKPSNLMFSANGSVKLTDFGIAKIMGGDGQLVTRAGDILGTPAYIAPEQARGLALSPGTDVYALATMTYQLLSGQLPFPSGSDSMAVMFMHAFEQPTPLSEVAPRIPTAIADVVMRGLAIDPSDRYSSAESFAVALAEPATQAWGPDWLTPVGIPILGADTITSAATRNSHSAKAPTMGVAQHTVISGPRIKPTQPLPRAAVKLGDLKPSDVKPVRRLLKFPSPKIPAVAALVLGGLAATVAALGPVAAPTGGDLPPAMITIAGVDPTLGSIPVVDLAHPIPVTVNTPDPTDVTLTLKVLGFPVTKQEAQLHGSGAVPSPVSPLLVAGQLDAEVTVTTADKPPLIHGFTLRSIQSALPTATTVVGGSAPPISNPACGRCVAGVVPSAAARER
jgi:serine/threonine protein kinase